MADDAAAAQADEIEALQSIYVDNEYEGERMGERKRATRIAPPSLAHALIPASATRPTHLFMCRD